MDWTNKSDTELERYGAEESGRVLKTDAKKCKVCGYGDVSVVTRDKNEESFVIYTRDGTVTGVHQEYRCNYRKKSCRAGHY